MLRRLGRTVREALVPLPFLGNWAPAIAVCVLLLTGSGAAAASVQFGGADHVSGISWGLVAIFGAISVLLFNALYQRVTKEEARRIPRNRDALVGAISEFEHAASNELLLLQAYQLATETLRRRGSADDPNESSRLEEIGRDVQRAREQCLAASRTLKKEHRIAGPDFEQVFRIYAGNIFSALLGCEFGEEVTLDNFVRSGETIRQQTTEVLSKLDAGAVCEPSS